MDTREIYGKSMDMSSPYVPSVISRAVARSRMLLYARSSSTANIRQRSSTTDPCPRCGRDLRAQLWLAHAKAKEYLIGLIKQDHLEWEEHDGTCPRCELYYRKLVEQTHV